MFVPYDCKKHSHFLSLVNKKKKSWYLVNLLNETYINVFFFTRSWKCLVKAFHCYIMKVGFLLILFSKLMLKFEIFVAVLLATWW